MSSNQGVSLKHINTFFLSIYAKQLIIADSVNTLLRAWHKAKSDDQPVLLLGEGSNILFIENFAGTILLNRIKGIVCKHSQDAFHLHVGAGENWHDLVCYTLKNNIAGLENMALIPGSVGAAPIQNIGAYGVELSNFCEYVDLLNLYSGDIQRLTAKQCQFGYRDSVFKGRYKNGYAIIAVGFKINKKWQPFLDYSELTCFHFSTVTPAQIFDFVCAVRRKKLPDPKQRGNAGSFFKNPIIEIKKAKEILKEYPHAPYYLEPKSLEPKSLEPKSLEPKSLEPKSLESTSLESKNLESRSPESNSPQSNDRVKLSAGWLIDQCSLKGYRIGGASVYNKQALVIVNEDNASGEDILNLACYVRNQVGLTFGIWLEPEVRLISSQGEINAIDCFL